MHSSGDAGFLSSFFPSSRRVVPLSTSDLARNVELPARSNRPMSSTYGSPTTGLRGMSFVGRDMNALPGRSGAQPSSPTHEVPHNTSDVSEPHVGRVVKAFVVFVLGYVLMPLSPLFLLFTTCYQLCLVQGRLSPDARVATAVGSVFLAIAWIPYVSFFIFWFQTTPVNREDISIVINGVAPLVLHSMMYVWAAFVGLRYYSIDDSYEQEKDRHTVQRLKEIQLKPAVKISYTLASHAYTTGRHYHADLRLARDAEAEVALAPMHMEAAPLSETTFGRVESVSGSTQRNVSVAEFRALRHRKAIKKAQRAGAEASQRGGGTSMTGSSSSDDDGDNEAASGPTRVVRGDVEIRTVFDLYVLLKDEVNTGAYTALGIGLFLSAVTVALARGVEYYSPPARDYNKEPLYALSTVYFVGIFFVFFTALAYVWILYRTNTSLVPLLTSLHRGQSSLSSEQTTADSLEQALRAIAKQSSRSGSGGDGPTLTTLASGTSSSQRHHQGQRASSSASTLSAASPFVDAVASNPHFAGEPEHLQSWGQLRRRALTSQLTAEDCKCLIVEHLNPYEPSHLRAWDEIRRIAADTIASSNSVLNSFFTPTIALAVIGFVGIFTSMMVRVLFIQSEAQVSGPFFITEAILVVVFASYLMWIFYLARRTRRAFKDHQLIVSKVAFDVAREMELQTRAQEELGADLSGGGGLVVDVRGGSRKESGANARASYSLYGGGSFGMQSALVAAAKHARDLGLPPAHELPVGLEALTSLLDTVSSLCAMMTATTPRPLLLGIEQRHMRYVITYVLIIFALLMFFALMSSMRKGRCNYSPG